VNVHVATVSVSWGVVGLALIAFAGWGLATEEHSQSVVVSWLIVLAFGVIAVTAAITFPRGELMGRVLVRLTSVLALLYAAMWLLLGGVEDAGGYWPWIILGTTLSIYALVASRKPRAA